MCATLPRRRNRGFPNPNTCGCLTYTPLAPPNPNIAASSPASTSTSESSKPSESEGALASLVSAAILVSPFLFWGTSMVAMKGTLEHTTPYFVAFARLAPAGALVVAYALSQGRKIPEGAAAWGAVSLFALVDAAMFQVCRS